LENALLIQEWLIFVASAIAISALVTAGVSLWIHYRTGSLTELRSRVRQLDLDLHDLFDTVEKWTRRDRVRRLREGRESEQTSEPTQPQTVADVKAELRRRAAL
jgi:hypothetical protein